MKLFEAVVEATHRHKTIFYGDNNDTNDEGAGGY
jgi:hypothetical protein